MSIALKTHKFGGSGAAPNTRALLMSFGLGSFGAQLAAQSIFFIPRTTDPDAQATILLVNAVQYGLAEMGAPVVVTGILDEPTVKYLTAVSGPNWHGKSWAQLLDELTRARQIGRGFEVTPQADLSGYPGESFLSPFEPAAAAVYTFYREHPIIALTGVVGGAFLLLRSRRRR